MVCSALFALRFFVFFFFVVAVVLQFLLLVIWLPCLHYCSFYPHCNSLAWPSPPGAATYPGICSQVSCVAVMGKGNWRQQPGLLGQIKACTIASLIRNTLMMQYIHVVVFSTNNLKHYCNKMKLSGHWESQNQSLLTVLLFYFFYVPLFLAFAAVKAVSFYYQQAFLCTIVSVNPEVFITPMAWRAQAFGKVCFLRSSPSLE